MKESIAPPRETLAWCCMSTFHPSSHMLNPIGSRISMLRVSKRHGTKFKLLRVCHYYIMLEQDLPVNFHWTSASSIKMNQVLPKALSRMSDLEDRTNNGTWKIIQAPKQKMDWQILTFDFFEKGSVSVRVICILLRWYVFVVLPRCLLRALEGGTSSTICFWRARTVHHGKMLLKCFFHLLFKQTWHTASYGIITASYNS